MKVLIIEDELLIIEIFTSFLKMQNIKCELQAGQDGASGLKKIEEEKFDIILLDHYLPQITGADIAKKTRENSQGPNQATPILILSTDKETVENLPSQISNCQALMKPVKPKQFKEAIKSLCPDLE
ncbi:MAG: response regulator [Bacteriovoracaceae bacterium]